MKWFCGVLFLVALGCGKSASQFDTGLQGFVTEAKRLGNQIEMGMPELDQAQQAQKIRNLLAGLEPLRPADKTRFDAARELCQQLELSARENRLLSHMVSREQPSAADKENIAKVRGSCEARQAEITTLFSKLTGAKAD